jgi:hypothetical protein
MTPIIGLRLALMLDAGGRFVAMLRVHPDTNKVVGLPHTSFDEHANDRMGLVPDRLPVVGASRSFRLRGEYSIPGDGEAVLMFKEEAA